MQELITQVRSEKCSLQAAAILGEPPQTSVTLPPHPHHWFTIESIVWVTLLRLLFPGLISTTRGTDCAEGLEKPGRCPLFSIFQTPQLLGINHIRSGLCHCLFPFFNQEGSLTLSVPADGLCSVFRAMLTTVVESLMWQACAEFPSLLNPCEIFRCK